jgi:hypothetical protein
MDATRTKEPAVDLDTLWNSATEAVDKLCLEYAVKLGTRESRVDTFDLLKAVRKMLDQAGDLA